MLPHQGPESIFEPKAGKEGRFLSSGLGVEVNLRGPPTCDAVFELAGERAVTVAVRGPADSRLRLNLEVSGLLEVMGVGNEVGLLLAVGGGTGEGREEGKKKEGQEEPATD